MVTVTSETYIAAKEWYNSCIGRYLAETFELYGIEIGLEAHELQFISFDELEPGIQERIAKFYKRHRVELDN